MAKYSVGIDVTEKDIKMISLIKKGENYCLSDYAMVKRSDLEGVKKIIQNPSIRRGTVRISIHDGTIKIRKITVPVVPKQELDEVIKWALKDAIKIPVEEFIIRYYPLSGASDKQQSYLAMAMERKKLQEYLIELQKIGISDPELVESHVQALAICVNHNYNLKNTDRCAVIHLDSQLSYCVVISSDGILFYRTFSYTNGGNSVDIAQFLSKLAVEIQYSCENYTEQFSNQPITLAILSGEEANLTGLKLCVEETLQTSTIPLETFKKIEINDVQRADLSDKAIQYSIALGLAL